MVHFKKRAHRTVPTKFYKYYQTKLSQLVSSLSQFFKKSIVLHLTRLYSPFLDGNILANLMGLLITIEKSRRIRAFNLARMKIKNSYK